MVGFNLSAEDRDKLVAEYEAMAESGSKPEKRVVSAKSEGADAAAASETDKPVKRGK